MNTIARLAYRNTLRRRVRTLLTSGMVVVGVALLLIALTWVRGAFGSMLASSAAVNGHVRIADPAFVAREELMPLDAHLQDLPRWEALLSAQPGVAAVEPRITSAVTVTAGDEIGEVFGLAVGASERYFRERLGAREKLSEGTWFTGAADEIVAGAKIVELTGAKVGDELLLLGSTQDGALSPVKGRLIGIVRTGGALDQQLFLPLAKLQYLADIEGATELLVYAPHHDRALELAARLRTLPELAKADVATFTEREPWRSLSGTVRGMQGSIVAIIVLLAALGIWNTMMMSVLERTHEIGVLRAMGLTKLGTVALFVGEALVIGVAGGVLGVLAGALPAWLLATKGIRIGEQVASNMGTMVSETIYGDFTVETVLLSFGLGVVMAVFGSVVPAIRAANIQPVAAMRSGR